MPWRYHELRKLEDGSQASMDRPGAEGIHIDGPLSVEDLKAIIEELVAELARVAAAGKGW